MTETGPNATKCNRTAVSVAVALVLKFFGCQSQGLKKFWKNWLTLVATGFLSIYRSTEYIKYYYSLQSKRNTSIYNIAKYSNLNDTP